ncbi:hypothetical protein JCM10212_004022 [Sporobolomyces blumeae]
MRLAWASWAIGISSLLGAFAAAELAVDGSSPVAVKLAANDLSVEITDARNLIPEGLASRGDLVKRLEETSLVFSLQDASAPEDVEGDELDLLGLRDTVPTERIAAIIHAKVSYATLPQLATARLEFTPLPVVQMLPIQAEIPDTTSSDSKPDLELNEQSSVVIGDLEESVTVKTYSVVIKMPSVDQSGLASSDSRLSIFDTRITLRNDHENGRPRSFKSFELIPAPRPLDRPSALDHDAAQTAQEDDYLNDLFAGASKADRIAPVGNKAKQFRKDDQNKRPDGRPGMPKRPDGRPDEGRLPSMPRPPPPGKPRRPPPDGRRLPPPPDGRRLPPPPDGRRPPPPPAGNRPPPPGSRPDVPSRSERQRNDDDFPEFPPLERENMVALAIGTSAHTRIAVLTPATLGALALFLRAAWSQFAKRRTQRLMTLEEFLRDEEKEEEEKRQTRVQVVVD